MVKIILSTILSIILLVPMMALTSLGYLSTSRFVFAGGSVEAFMNLAVMHVALPTVLLVLFALLLFSYFRNPKKMKIGFLAIVFFSWILSGRTIGSIMWPEARIISGWFYVETERVYLCDGKVDCETVVAYQTKTEPLAFWRVRVKNTTTNKVIFVGPFIWNKTLKVFKEDIGAGKYTQ